MHWPVAISNRLVVVPVKKPIAQIAGEPDNGPELLVLRSSGRIQIDDPVLEIDLLSRSGRKSPPAEPTC